MDLLDLEFAAVCLAVWAASLVLLWRAVDRRGGRGWIRNKLAIDLMMLTSLGCLVCGISLLIKGSGIFS